MSDSDKLPVFVCAEVGDHWVFWCPFCLARHRHGAGRGARAAHCTSPTSPLRSTGYVLEARGFRPTAAQRRARAAVPPVEPEFRLTIRHGKPLPVSETDWI